MRSNLAIRVMILICCVGVAKGTVTFDDGGTHDINYKINDEVWIYNGSSGAKTTLNFLDGALVTYNHPVTGFENSVMNIFGGQIPGVVTAKDNAKIAMDGGTIADIYAHDESSVSVSSGSITWSLRGYGNSEIDVTGGQIHSVSGSYDSKINLLGGTIEQASFSGNSVVNLSGSIIQINLTIRGNNKINISGGTIYGDLKMWDESQAILSGGLIGGDLIAVEASQITIQGTGFNYELGQITAPVGTLTGILLNGDPINNSFFIHDNATIILESPPELAEPTELPVADAGADIIADANQVVVLNAGASYDPDGHIVEYTWTALPENEVLYSGTEITFATKALGRVEEVIKLTVTDDKGASSEDFVSIFNKRVEDIELTPGPEGSQGEQGLQGVQGTQGIQGEQGLTGSVG